MSLSLDQINKKSAKKSRSSKEKLKTAEHLPKAMVESPLNGNLDLVVAPVTADHQKEASPESSAVLQKKPVRPWSSRGLAKEGKSRSKLYKSDESMNQSWMDLQESPLFWYDLQQSPVLTKIEEVLCDLEDTVQPFIAKPIEQYETLKKKFENKCIDFFGKKNSFGIRRGRR